MATGNVVVSVILRGIGTSLGSAISILRRTR
jgi:hypothetical protein